MIRHSRAWCLCEGAEDQGREDVCARALLPPGLLTHRFGEEKRQQMADAARQKSRVRKPKDPEREFHGSIYFIGDPDCRRYGIPAIAFKQAMVNGCRVVQGLSMSRLGRCFRSRMCR